ncbi:MAG: glucose-6-phosphate dehydrogenase assembly protein OpcA [Micrococcales bacterium]|nr:glucose-6-phosphate dehydrogenase assembly protein OpcA [Micrococcales bacterium]
MIIPIYATSVSQVATRLVELRAQAGVAAQARALNLVVQCEPGELESSVQVLRVAAMEHPCRAIVVTTESPDEPAALDAQIRLGSDGGSGEIVVLRAIGRAATSLEAIVAPLLVPDLPVVVWWPATRPEVPATSALGRMAVRRITDSREAPNREAALKALTSAYHPGDGDLAWARLSPWRAQLTGALAQSDAGTVTSAVISAPTAVAADLMAAWVAQSLHVTVRRAPGLTGSISSIELYFRGGSHLVLDKEHTQAGAVLRQSGHDRQHLVLSRRSTAECLAEELRCLAPDLVYEQLVTQALPSYLPSAIGQASS